MVQLLAGDRNTHGPLVRHNSPGREHRPLRTGGTSFINSSKRSRSRTKLQRCPRLAAASTPFWRGGRTAQPLQKEHNLRHGPQAKTATKLCALARRAPESRTWLHRRSSSSSRLPPFACSQSRMAQLAVSKQPAAQPTYLRLLSRQMPLGAFSAILRGGLYPSQVDHWCIPRTECGQRGTSRSPGAPLSKRGMRASEL